MWEFPKIRGTILGVPILRTIVFWALFGVSPILGKDQCVAFLLCTLFESQRPDEGCSIRSEISMLGTAVTF